MNSIFQLKMKEDLDKPYHPIFEIPRRPRGKLIRIEPISLEGRKLENDIDFLNLIDEQEVACVFERTEKWDKLPIKEFSFTRQKMQVRIWLNCVGKLYETHTKINRIHIFITHMYSWFFNFRKWRNFLEFSNILSKMKRRYHGRKSKENENQDPGMEKQL